jgi:anti-anti-sigma factor
MEPAIPFSVDVTRLDGALVVAPAGEIDIATAPLVREALEDAGREASVVVMDFRQVDFMDTSGLQLLIQERRHAEESGRGFAVVRGPSRVQRLLDIAGLTPMLTLVDTPEEALGGAGSASG